MNQKALNALEYPKIIEKLTDKASSYMGKQLCKNLEASNCSLEEGRKMKKCKLVQNIMNFKFCYIIFCAIICFIVLSVPTFAKIGRAHV